MYLDLTTKPYIKKEPTKSAPIILSKDTATEATKDVQIKLYHPIFGLRGKIREIAIMNKARDRISL
jgi:hypothetical protein